METCTSSIERTGKNAGWWEWILGQEVWSELWENRDEVIIAFLYGLLLCMLVENNQDTRSECQCPYRPYVHSVQCILCLWPASNPDNVDKPNLFVFLLLLFLFLYDRAHRTVAVRCINSITRRWKINRARRKLTKNEKDAIRTLKFASNVLPSQDYSSASIHRRWPHKELCKYSARSKVLSFPINGISGKYIMNVYIAIQTILHGKLHSVFVGVPNSYSFFASFTFPCEFDSPYCLIGAGVITALQGQGRKGACPFKETRMHRLRSEWILQLPLGRCWLSLGLFSMLLFFSGITFCNP